MKHILFGSDISKVKVALLIKESAFFKQKLRNYYVSPYADEELFIAFDLAYSLNGKKAPVTMQMECLHEVLPEIENLGINCILCCDTNYFKTLTKTAVKSDKAYGYSIPCAIEGYTHMNVILAPNYQVLLYNPNYQEKLNISLETVKTTLNSTYVNPGTKIIHYQYYPDTLDAIQTNLEMLMNYPALTVDIEATSLNFWEAEIESIAFGWDKHSFISFCVTRDNIPSKVSKIHSLLRVWFEAYTGKLIWQNLGYDGKVLTFRLWMNSKLDNYAGMLKGINIMTRNFEDTKLIAYLATNNAVQNKLGLKDLSIEYMGDYGIL